MRKLTRSITGIALALALLTPSATGLGAELLPTLKPGSTGLQVTILQSMLHGAGQSVQVNGTYDDATRQAVAAFEKGAGLAVDGVVGAGVWGRLAAAAGATAGKGSLLYAVHSGDSLSTIAERFGTTSMALATWNHLTDVNHIEVGSTLTLVGPDSAAGAARVAEPATQSNLPATPPQPSAATAPQAPSAASQDDASNPVVPAMVLLPAAGVSSDLASGSAAAAASPTYLPAGDKPLALTFDDLPSAQDLPGLLQVLQESGLKATFFLDGETAEQHPDVVKALVQAGQEIESHGYHHVSWAGKAARDQLADVLRAQDVLNGLTGQAPRYYRPPGGGYDDNLQASVRQAHLQMVMWSSINLRDQAELSTTELLDAVKQAAFPGAVLMLHAGRSATLTQLPALINAINGAGFRSVPLAQLLGRA